MQPVRLVREVEIDHALIGQGYTIESQRDGLTFYAHPELPDAPVVVDHSKGPIPFDLLQASLELQGVNMDAFCAFLEE